MSVVVDKKNKKNNTIKGFSKISSDSFPFACYFDKKTIVTKNGETMQTIAITCQDNNANINGILSENIKNAIQSALGQEYFDYSFWVHSVKINDESIAEIKNSEFGNPIYQLIKNDWEYYQKTFDNYMVVTFVTFVKISMSLKINPSNLMLFLNKSLLYNVHNTFIKRSSSLLNGVVNKVINQLQQYNVKRLEIIKTDEGYNSEHLAFWDRIVNFGNCEYGVPVADLSEVINRSLYKFDNNILSLKNNTDKKYCAFFTLKDNNNISSILISDIVSKLKNMIMFETFHFEPPSSIKKKYHSQILQIKKKTITDTMISIAGLDCLTDINTSKDLFCKHYGGLVLICDSEEELTEEIKVMSSVCVQNGVVFGYEDIGVERAFYSMMPANFNYIYHYNLIPFKDTLSLVNSHKMDNDNIEFYRDKKIICILPTLKKYPYAFGILKNKPDIIISGPKHSEAKKIFSKTLISFLSAEFKNICIIDSSKSFKSFVEMSEGSYYDIDRTKTNNSPSFCPFKLKQVGEITNIEIITNMISMMVMSMGGKLKSSDIDKIAKAVIDAKNIGDITSAVPNAQKELEKWQKNGKMGFLFDSQNDSLETDILAHNKAMICFNLSEKIMANRQLRALISYYIILKFISISEQNNLIVINDPILLIDHHTFDLDLDLLQKEATKKNIVFMFINTDNPDCLIGEKTKLSIKSLLKNCDTQFHFGGTKTSEQYNNAYDITSGESYAMHNISSQLSNAILKQNGIILPVSLSTHFMNNQIIDVLQNSSSIQNKIAKIQLDNKTTDPISTLQTLLTNPELHIVDLNAEESLMLEKRKTEDVAMQIINAA